MPLLNDLMLDQKALTANHYGYSATRIEDLGASEYTLVSIVTDASSSVADFHKELEQTLKQIVQACQFSPRADNLMLRLLEFNTKVKELHGFKLLDRCNLSDYTKILNVGGSTALFDAAENAITATIDYGKQLTAGDFSANGIIFVITDGMDNASKLTANTVRQALMRAVSEEALDSIVTILIGVNVKDQTVSRYLNDVNQQTGFTQYIELEKADPKTLAKLAEFVSKSISVQSKALGTGAASQSLTF